MKDTLTYRCSGDSGFNAAINGCKEWIDKNANGPLTLTYSISLKLTPPEGESIREISKTEPMFVNGRKRRGKTSEEPEEATE